LYENEDEETIAENEEITVSLGPDGHLSGMSQGDE
jgi:hypothetical protein